MLGVRSTSFVATPSGKQNDSTFSRSARGFLFGFRRASASAPASATPLGGYANNTRAGCVTPDVPLCGFLFCGGLASTRERRSALAARAAEELSAVAVTFASGGTPTTKNRSKGASGRSSSSSSFASFASFASRAR